MGATYAHIGGEPPEWQTRKRFEDRFGPIPDGITPKQVEVVYFQAGYGARGARGVIASVGVYPTTPPPEPEYSAEQAAYLAKVAAAAKEELTKSRAEAVVAERKKSKAARAWLRRQRGKPIVIEGPATIIDHDYGAWDVRFGDDTYLLDSIMPGERREQFENKPLGNVRITIEFLP